MTPQDKIAALQQIKQELLQSQDGTPEERAAISAKIDMAVQKFQPSAGAVAMEQAVKPPLEQMGDMAENVLPQVGDKMADVIVSGLQEHGIHPSVAKTAGFVMSQLMRTPKYFAEGMAGAGAGPVLQAGAEAAGPVAETVMSKMPAGVQKFGAALRQTGAKEVDALGIKQAERAAAQTSALNRTKQAGEFVGGKADEALADAASKVQNVQETIKGIPVRQRMATQTAQNARQVAKTAMDTAEEGLGIGPKTVGPAQIAEHIKDPAKFIETYSGVAANHTPKELAAQMPPEVLQEIRKAAENMPRRGLDKLSNNSLYEIQAKFRDAIGVGSKEFEKAAEAFKTAEVRLRGIPDEYRGAKDVLNSALQTAKNDAAVLTKARKTGILPDGAAAREMRLMKAAHFLEQRAKTLPQQFAEQRSALAVAAEKAKALAAEQARLRRTGFFLGAGSAMSYGGYRAGRKLLGKVED